MVKRRGFFQICSKLLFNIIVLLTFLLVIVAIAFKILGKITLAVSKFLFDGNYFQKYYDFLNENTFDLPSKGFEKLLGHDISLSTIGWSDNVASISNGNSDLVQTLIFYLVATIVLYGITIVMRHHYGEMAPFLNDIEAIRVKYTLINRTGSWFVNKTDEKGRKIPKIELLARRRIRWRTKVKIITKIDKGDPKPIKSYQVKMKIPKKMKVKDRMHSIVKELHIELTSITNGISFDQIRTSPNKKYYIFDGSKEVKLKEARSVVKSRNNKTSKKENKNNDINDILQFPLSLLADNSKKIADQTVAANSFAESKEATIETYFSSIGMSVEYIGKSVGNTAIEYRYSDRFGNSTKSEATLTSELGTELKNSSVQVYMSAGYIKVNLPLPKKKRIPIDTKSTMINHLVNTSEPTVAIWGVTVENKVFVAPIAESPHILAAGQTKSGKSVWLNSMLITMLAHNTPETLKLAIVDPKKNEFIDYRGLAHNIADPITDMKDAETFIRYIEQLAEDRYRLFEKTNKRNIYRYNEWAQENGKEILPFVVVLVDEWNNLRKQAKDIESPLEGLGEKARAAGLQLIVATQRPSADVLPGTIKANLPTKVSLKVDSTINSKIILGQPGAEKLNGHGDMLISYDSSDDLQRAQGLYFSDAEITDITSHLRKKFGKPNFVDYKGYMARFDGEEESEEENEQFQAITDYQSTAMNYTKEEENETKEVQKEEPKTKKVTIDPSLYKNTNNKNKKTESPNKRKSKEDMSEIEKIIYEKAVKRCEENKKLKQKSI